MLEPQRGADDLADRLRELEPLWLEARDAGFLGPAPITDHLEHSLAFLEALDESLPAGAIGHILDLGSGAGVPGLATAIAKPSSRVTLLEGSERRTAWLRQSVSALGLQNVEVVSARAEEFGRRADRRGTLDVVTARAFGAPGVTAECAAPLLRVGGTLLVSEPPTGGDQARLVVGASSHGAGAPKVPARWPATALTQLGLGAAQVVECRGRRFVALVQGAACPPRYPRRVGIPQKRPLF